MYCFSYGIKGTCTCVLATCLTCTEECYSLLEQTRRHGAGMAPKSAGEDPPSGASYISHFRRWKSVTFGAVLRTFRRRPGDFPAPETTCLCGLIIIPAPSWGLSGAHLFHFAVHICVLVNAPSAMQCFNQINCKQVFNHLRIKE